MSEQTALVKPVPAELAAYVPQNVEATGFENIDPGERITPFLVLLQDGSPQVKPKHDAYIEGAKAGSILNKSSSDVYDGDQGFLFVACNRRRTYVEWIPRNDKGGGGGYVGEHLPTSQEVIAAKRKYGERGRLKTEQGNDLKETIYVYGFVIPTKQGVDLSKGRTSLDEVMDPTKDPIPVCIPVESTKLQPWKAAFNAMGSLRFPGVPAPNNVPAMYQHVIHVTTEFQQRDAGDSFNYKFSPAFGPKFSLDSLLRTDSPLFLLGSQIAAAVTAGTIKTEQPPAGGESGDHVPF